MILNLSPFELQLLRVQRYFRRKQWRENPDILHAHKERHKKISEQEELFLLAVANYDGGVDEAKMLSDVIQVR
jgi:hypothetical protein